MVRKSWRAPGAILNFRRWLLNDATAAIAS